MNERCAAVESLLSAWLDGELTLSERARVEEHVRTCARCAADVDTLRRTQQLVRSLPVRAVPEHVAPARRVPAPPPAPPVRRRARVAASVAAVGLVLSGAAVVVGAQAQRQPTVQVPVDVFAADHLAQTFRGAVTTPVLLKRP